MIETCHYAVSREGELQPCDKPAVGLRVCEGEFADYPPYPVCRRHFNKRKQPRASGSDPITGVIGSADH